MRKSVKRQKDKGAIANLPETRAKLERLVKSEVQKSKPKELDNK